MTDLLVDERGYQLLKYDSYGHPVYVKPKEYNAIMGEGHKRRCRRKRKGTKPRKKR